MKNSGMTLIELMISLTLGLLLSAILFDCYQHAQGSLKMQSTVYRLQVASSAVLDAIAHEIQQAGYIGCAHLMPGFPLKGDGEYNMTTINQLQVKDNYFISRHASYLNVALIEQASNLRTLYVGDEIDFEPGNRLIISDCLHAEIFQVAKVFHLQHKLRIDSVVPLHSRFAEDAEIAYFEINRYYIGTLMNKNWFGKPVSVLYVENIEHVHRPLQDGIEEMKFIPYFQRGILHAVAFSMVFHADELTRKWHGYVKIG
jgi:prepilin-type N-terminal cleavage/methylation domain-containing protein